MNTSTTNYITTTYTHHGTCPTCGRCRCCGGNDNIYISPYTQPYPTWTSYTPAPGIVVDSAGAQGTLTFI